MRVLRTGDRQVASAVVRPARGMAWSGRPIHPGEAGRGQDGACDQGLDHEEIGGKDRENGLRPRPDAPAADHRHHPVRPKPSLDGPVRHTQRDLAASHLPKPGRRVVLESGEPVPPLRRHERAIRPVSEPAIATARHDRVDRVPDRRRHVSKEAQPAPRAAEVVGGRRGPHRTGPARRRPAGRGRSPRDRLSKSRGGPPPRGPRATTRRRSEAHGPAREPGRTRPSRCTGRSRCRRRSSAASPAR